MNCPVCGEKMREIEKHGVHLDICPGCKGIWLDKGELEKIIDRVGGAGLETPPPAESPVAEAPWPAGPNFEPARPPREDFPRPAYEQPPYRRRDDDDDDDDDDRRHRGFPGDQGYRGQYEHQGQHDRYQGKPYKKKHWLSEILENFGD